MPQLKKNSQLKYNAKNATWCVVFFSAENVADIYLATQDYFADNEISPNLLTDATWQLQLERYVLSNLYHGKLKRAYQSQSNKLNLTKVEATILVKLLSLEAETLLCLGRISQ